MSSSSRNSHSPTASSSSFSSTKRSHRQMYEQLKITVRDNKMTSIDETSIPAESNNSNNSCDSISNNNFNPQKKHNHSPEKNRMPSRQQIQEMNKINSEMDGKEIDETLSPSKKAALEAIERALLGPQYAKKSLVDGLNFEEGVINPLAFLNENDNIIQQGSHQAPWQYLYTTPSDTSKSETDSNSRTHSSIDSSGITNNLTHTFSEAKTPDFNEPMSQAKTPIMSNSASQSPLFVPNSPVTPVLSQNDFEDAPTLPLTPPPTITGYYTTDGETSTSGSGHSSPAIHRMSRN